LYLSGKSRGFIPLLFSPSIKGDKMKNKQTVRGGAVLIKPKPAKYHSDYYYLKELERLCVKLRKSKVLQAGEDNAWIVIQLEIVRIMVKHNLKLSYRR
jgi:hypothetical protein